MQILVGFYVQQGISVSLHSNGLPDVGRVYLGILVVVRISQMRVGKYRGKFEEYLGHDLEFTLFSLLHR